MSTDTKTVRAWALVSPRGKINVDTICEDRETVTFLCAGRLEEQRYRPRRVVVSLVPARRDHA